MRKIIIFLSAFISVLILFVIVGFKTGVVHATSTVINSNCLTITGKFTAKNWVGGAMMVGCGGDNGKYCKGQVATVKPGKTFTLTKCSCPPYASGCLVIGRTVKLKNDGTANRPRAHIIGDKVPNKCVLTHKNNVCGTNGHAITVNFKVTCRAPTPTNTPTPTVTNTPTPTPSVCPVPEPVLNVKITCPNCSQSRTSVSPVIACGGADAKACPTGYSCKLTDATVTDKAGTCVVNSTGGSNQ